MDEIWKEIKNYEGYYQISNRGRVKGIVEVKKYKEGRILTPWSNHRGRGYLKVKLIKNGTGKYAYVHRLVAQAFIDNPNHYTEVNHKDENPKNNTVENLEWCTRKYNMSYGTIQDRRREAFRQKKIAK